MRCAQGLKVVPNRYPANDLLLVYVVCSKRIEYDFINHIVKLIVHSPVGKFGFFVLFCFFLVGGGGGGGNGAEGV